MSSNNDRCFCGKIKTYPLCWHDTISHNNDVSVGDLVLIINESTNAVVSDVNKFNFMVTLFVDNVYIWRCAHQLKILNAPCTPSS